MYRYNVTYSILHPPLGYNRPTYIEVVATANNINANANIALAIQKLFKKKKLFKPLQYYEGQGTPPVWLGYYVGYTERHLLGFNSMQINHVLWKFEGEYLQPSVRHAIVHELSFDHAILETLNYNTPVFLLSNQPIESTEQEYDEGGKNWVYKTFSIPWPWKRWQVITVLAIITCIAIFIYNAPPEPQAESTSPSPCADGCILSSKCGFPPIAARGSYYYFPGDLTYLSSTIQAEKPEIDYFCYESEAINNGYIGAP